MSTPQEIMANRIIGKDILIWVDVADVATLVAGQREGGIDISRESVDLTTKDDWVVAGEAGSQGTGMRLFKPSFGTWKATLGGIITYDAAGADLLTAAVLNAEQVMITVAVGTRTFKGLCNINSFNKTGAMAGEATYTADLQGCGALVLTGGEHGTRVSVLPAVTAGAVAAVTLPQATTTRSAGSYVVDSATITLNDVPLLVKIGDGSTTPGWDVAITAGGAGGTLTFAGTAITAALANQECRVTYRYTTTAL